MFSPKVKNVGSSYFTSFTRHLPQNVNQTANGEIYNRIALRSEQIEYIERVSDRVYETGHRKEKKCKSRKHDMGRTRGGRDEIDQHEPVGMITMTKEKKKDDGEREWW